MIAVGAGIQHLSPLLPTESLLHLCPSKLKAEQFRQGLLWLATSGEETAIVAKNAELGFLELFLFSEIL